MSREVSLKKLVSNSVYNQASPIQLNKSLSKSTIQDPNLKMKSYRDQLCRSPKNSYREKQKERIYEKFLGNHKNANIEQRKQSKSPTVKRIMFEVHKNLKDDF